MSVIYEHLPFYREIFSIKGFLKDPLLLIGIPRMTGFMPEDFDFQDLASLLEARGVKKVVALDLFDDQAEIRHDLNKPIPDKEAGKYEVVFDMGSIEHVFDTKQCLENYFRLVKKGGLLAIVTAVNGYLGHGLHVFNPDLLEQALKLNGFDIVYQKYVTSTGIELDSPNPKKNVLIWIVAKKRKEVRPFVVPQQEGWDELYQLGQESKVPSAKDKFMLLVGKLKRSVYYKLPKFLQKLY